MILYNNYYLQFHDDDGHAHYANAWYTDKEMQEEATNNMNVFITENYSITIKLIWVNMETRYLTEDSMNFQIVLLKASFF